MSHHESGNFDQASSKLIQELLGKQQKNLQGEFPRGRLNPADEGAVSMAVRAENGTVIIQFPHPTVWVGFPPDDAVKLAQALIEKARALGAVVTLKV